MVRSSEAQSIGIRAADRDTGWWMRTRRGRRAVRSRRASVARVVLIGVVVAATACAPTPSGDGGEIGPNQRFSGLVNGHRDGAVVHTVCGGPVWEGRTGPVASGQTLSVTRDTRGNGETGAYRSVFAQPRYSGSVVIFSTYDEPRQWPAGLEVPCDGKGTVAFLQCFGIIACTSGSPDLVSVTFVNIAL